MDYACKYYPIRQSTRLPLEIPLLVTGLSPEDQHSEDCRTVLVNAHGCGLTSTHRFERGAFVQLQLIESGSTAIARVVDVVALDEGCASWLIGLALEKPGNFWGIQYAPSDWDITESGGIAVGAQMVEPDRHPIVQTAMEKAKNSRASCHLAAISSGACYLQTETTFPRQTPVIVRISVAGSERSFTGTVLVEHAQSGIGVEFTGRDRDHRNRIQNLIDKLCNDGNPHPRVQVLCPDLELQHSNRVAATAGASEPHDSLLALILVGSRLTRNDFLRELERQRRSSR